MLTVRTGFSDYKVSEVAPYLREAAAAREGEWTVRIYEARGCCLMPYRTMDAYDITLTEEEYSKISRTLYHGLRNQTKSSSLFANLENAAQALWPTGSLDHVAMRHMGVIAVSQYVTKEVTANGCCLGSLCCIAKCMQWEQVPELFRTSSATRPAQATMGYGSTDTTGSPASANSLRQQGMPAISHDPLGSPPQPCVTTATQYYRVDTMDQPSMPGDMDAAAGAADDGRTVVVGEVVAVVGQNFNKDEPNNHMPIVGALVGPCQVKPNVYSKTASNLEAAVNERIIKKARVPNINKADRARIGGLISTAMSNDATRGVFSKKRIQDWAIEHLDLEANKSKKWNTARFRNALENLYKKESPEAIFKAGIKPENMPEGKAPRMLIADGDEGQLMALTVVKCFEELLFEHFEDRSIKHAAKRDAMGRVVDNLKKKGARAIEGDGSAWDTTCNVLVRKLIENPILKHIMQVLAEFGVVPESWMEEHQRACEQQKLKLFFSNKFEKMTVTIDAIRRSGHRGTSCLNWWINYVMWVSSVFREPKRFLDPTVRKGIDLTGRTRWWNGCFEGDDSLCTMDPPMRPHDELSNLFSKFWSDAGFNMKIVYCDTRATFVGWHIACDDGELTDVRCPELPRAMANSGVSVSPSTVQAAQTGDLKTIRMLAAASALARAADFSGILPTVSWKYKAFADGCNMYHFADREMSYRAFGEEGHNACNIRDIIDERNSLVSCEEEQQTLDKLGYNATNDELMTFSEYIWDLEPATLTAYDAFRESLPGTWRMVA